MITATFILGILVILILVIAIAWAVNVAEEYRNHKKIPIPFKESMDLLSVPVVTFVNNGVKLHFLLDTGSDYSYIDSQVVPTLEIKERNNQSIKVSTGNGSVESEGKVVMDIHYKEHSFEESFVVQDLASHFERAFGSYGVIVHGVLGSAFFAKHKYEINFEDFTAYSKK